MELLVKGIEVFIVLLKDKLCLSKEIKKSQMALNFIYQRIEDSSRNNTTFSSFMVI
jgi:hypothetical protein